MTERYPEVALARRLIQRRNLSPPIDVVKLVREYADLHIVRIPAEFDFDGMCIGLKVPGRRPTVVVNKGRTEARIRFTLAHELGHIIIPWHTGTIVDNTTSVGNHEDIDFEYWEMEAEANRFASELLMPTQWVREFADKNPNPIDVLRRVMLDCKTSKKAATLKVAQCMPPNYVYLEVSNGVVVSSGRSPGTPADVPFRGSEFREDVFDYAARKWRSGSYFWWHLDVEEVESDPNDLRTWREILDLICSDIGLQAEEASSLKASVNGILAAANSHYRAYGVRQVRSAALQRLHANAPRSSAIIDLLRHPLCETFLAKRVAAFFS